jgi:hypothetical protein
MLRRRVDRVDRVCRIRRRETVVSDKLWQPRPDRYKRPLPAQEDAFKAALRNVGNTSILLKNPLFWRPHLGFVALLARQIPAS